MANTFVHKPNLSALGASPTIDITGTPPGGISFTAEDGSPTFVGAARVEGSADGVTWDDLGSVVAGAVLTQVAGVYKFVRANCTSYTSGNMTVKIVQYTPQ